ncbi:hypothetical protein HY031_02195, partial [Candidatus Gottesmanbacteria bacterium]|nr:hypothetical protein [Candidatus Gottesmanbacteria bacterium]
AQMLSSLGVALTTDIATNLLNAIYGATDNFTSPLVSSGAFEVAAVCARAGAKRFSRAVVEEEAPSGEAARGTAVRQVGKSAKVRPQGVTPAPQAVPSQSTQPGQGTQPPTSPSQAPADWLKPKIFKSSSLV